jgi:hypothetical protein
MISTFSDKAKAMNELTKGGRLKEDEIEIPILKKKILSDEKSLFIRKLHIHKPANILIFSIDHAEMLKSPPGKYH